MMKLISNNLLQKFCLFFWFLFFVSVVNGDEIELLITRNDSVNPSSKNDLWLHIISHKKEDVRAFTFRNGSVISIFLVSSNGNLIPSKKFSYSSVSHTEYRRPFHIYPGDVTGVLKSLKDFKLVANGTYYMLFAIPHPFKQGVIFSKPCKLQISVNNLIKTVETIQFVDLPPQVKPPLRKEFENFIFGEKLILLR